MQCLTSLYPAIQETINSSVPDYWPGLVQATEQIVKGPSYPEAALPIASCKAVGGNSEEAVPAAAAFTALRYSVWMFDDLFNQDKEGIRETIGLERSWNFASTIQNIAYAILCKSSLQTDIKQKIIQCIIDAFFAVAAGQDRDIAGIPHSEEEYWLTVELKSAYMYATACEIGALVGTENNAYITSCRIFGRHLGRSMQILNEMESIWQSKGEADLIQNKITLPIIYGLTIDHPEKTELAGIVDAGGLSDESKRVVEILNNIDTQKYLYWAALKERDEALEALSMCPDQEGKDALEAYVTGIFDDIDLSE